MLATALIVLCSYGNRCPKGPIIKAMSKACLISWLDFAASDWSAGEVSQLTDLVFINKKRYSSHKRAK